MPSSQYIYPDTEPIWAALFSLLANDPVLKPAVVTFSRQPVSVADLTNIQLPALFLAQMEESYLSTTQATAPQPRGLPRQLTLIGVIVLVINSLAPGLNATPLNAFTRAIRNALLPDTTGFLTLGGLVKDCFIQGNVVFDLGVAPATQALATIPINIYLP